MKHQRYIVDIRTGCGAVIDTLHEDYDKDAQGLHLDTGGVIEYKIGFRTSDGWCMKNEDVKFLNDLCDNLNKGIHEKKLNNFCKCIYDRLMKPISENEYECFECGKEIKQHEKINKHNDSFESQEHIFSDMIDILMKSNSNNPKQDIQLLINQFTIERKK